MFDRIHEGRWWDKAWSLVEGCTPCSPGCDHCWLRGIDRRFKRPLDRVRFVTDRLEIPRRRRKPTAWAIWSDLCHEAVRAGEAIAAFNVMRETPQHIYLLLTKRPQRLLELSSAIDWPANCWAGVTVCDQAEADAKLPLLLQVPAAVRFVSYEPALGPVDFRCIGEFRGQPLSALAEQVGFVERGSLHWVIAGGESGPDRRPAHPDWFRSVRDQCVAAGVPFFFKQWGWRSENRQLDRRTWDQLPRRLVGTDTGVVNPFWTEPDGKAGCADQ